MKPNIHVVHRPNGWAVKREGTERASSVHRTQAKAYSEALGTARKEHVEALLHGRDGKIRARESFGNDPRNIIDTEH